ncbi:hypothetical protein ACP4OV_024400 [Aristida adscensionis]
MLATDLGVPELEVQPSDTDALTIFRHSTDAHGILAANCNTGDACAGCWTSVGCSPDGRRVTSPSLPSLDLRGPLDPLSNLGELRALDLRSNRLNGKVDALLLGVPNLALLYLSHNDLSGALPAAIARLRGLLRIDLTDNSLSGPIPAAALANLTGLLTLKLQDNLLTGLLPNIAAAAVRPGGGRRRAVRCSDGARSKLVFFGVDGDGNKGDGYGDIDGSAGRKAQRARASPAYQQQVRPSKFQLEMLLRASVEMVCRGSLGTVYRAVLGDGRMVAVKRLRDANPCARDEFHRYMDFIGRLRHPNLVPLCAFYYAKQEKLLMYDYLPDGNLHDRLHCTISPRDQSCRILAAPALDLGVDAALRAPRGT